MSATLQPRPNPYVGPRAFRYGEALYGRDREVMELLGLLIAERIVLLYSPSGAGKTSLMQAALIPDLKKEDFHVLPVMRVSLEPSPGLERLPTTNRYVLSVLLSLEEALPEEQQMSLAELARMKLADYLDQREAGPEAPKPSVLIFDQFEEILTVDPTDRVAKEAFFAQVGTALRARHRWALFAMREEYSAGLDPYLRPIPTRLHTTFRLELLGEDAACQAMQRPARQADVEFTDAAARKLVNDLRRVRLQGPEGTTEVLGLYVEPVHLQVVCRRLWERLPADDREIREKDIEAIGDVDSALAGYYVERVATIAGETGVPERAIREWCDRQLITAQGIRGQVLQDHERSQGLENRAIARLVDAHLVRAEQRRGATWFELAHDRLIEPVRQNNAVWYQANLSALQRQADLWERQDRPGGLLLRDAALADAEQWASAHAEEMMAEEREFLEECRRAREAVKRERRASRRIRIWAVLATVVMVVAAALGGFAWMQYRHATAGELAGQALAELESRPALSLLLATHAVSMASTPVGEDVLRRALLKIPLRLTLQGHTGKISSVNYNFDSTRIVTASDDATVRMWDAITGQELHKLSHPAAVHYAAFSPNGALILTACRDKIARLWEVATRKEIRSFTGHPASLNTAVFSPDGKFVVTTSDDHVVRFWDIESGSARGVLDTHTESVRNAVLSPNGQYVATVGSDGTAQVWNLLTGETPKGFAAEGTNVAVSPDSRQLVTTQLYEAIQWDIASGEERRSYTGHTWYLSSVAFSHDGQLLLTGAESARLWDAETGTQLEILRGHQGSVTSIAFSPDGQWIVTASTDNTVRIFDLAVWRQYTLIGQTGHVSSAVYNHDGTQIATSNNYYEGDHPNVIEIWDVKTGRQLRVLHGHTHLIGKIAYRPDGKWLVSPSDDGTARVWDVASGQELYPDNRISSKKIIHTAVFNHDGTKIITAGRDNMAHIWDATTRQELVKPLQGHTQRLQGAEFSRDGQKVVTASLDYTARIWDATTGKELRALQGHEQLVTSARFSPDGGLVVTASVDGTARVWNVEAEAEPIVWILAGHTAEVTDAVFSPDARFIATASRDNTARLWDVATGNGVATLYGHTQHVMTVAYSADGKRLITASNDGTVRIHLTQPEERLALARAWLKCDLTRQEGGHYLPEQRDWLAHLLRADPVCGQKTR